MHAIIMFVMLLWVYIKPGRQESMKTTAGVDQIYDIWNASPMLHQLHYEVRSVQVCDISEMSLVSSIPM